jgi:GR25 family glycosyltransferase involved in LPS biosynthesis
MYKVRVISLKESLDRRKHVDEVLSKLNLNYSFFDAIDYRDVTDEIEKEMFSMVDYYEYNINQRAVMATFISHLELIKECYETKTNMFIMEDDIEIVRDFDFINVGFENFDVYNIGSDKIASLDCHSYFVSVEGAEKIMNHFKTIKITQAFDWEMVKIKNLRHYFTPNPIFIQEKNKFKSIIAPNGYENN